MPLVHSHEGANFDYVENCNRLLLPLPEPVTANFHDGFANDRFRDPDGPLLPPTIDDKPPCAQCRGGGTIETVNQYGLATLADCPVCRGTGEQETTEIAANRSGQGKHRQANDPDLLIPPQIEW